MTQKITGEAPFQVLSTNFSISPSLQNFILQISADGTNYSDLFTVSAGQTKMVTNVANGSYYRLKNNNSEVTINWRTQCNDGQGGGGGSYILPAATEQTLGGIKVGSGLTVQADGTLSANGGGGSVDNTILKSVTAFPVSAETGDVVALYKTITIYERIKVPETSISYDGDDILEITTDLGTLTINTFEDNGTNVIKFTNGIEGVEEFIVIGDNNSTTLPTNDENYTWDAVLKGGTLIIRVSDGVSFHPIFTEDSIVLNTCDAYLDEMADEVTNVGVYQYDGSSWNEIGGKPYKIELSTSIPDEFTQEDIANLEAFCAAADADPSIEDGAYLFINGDIYRNIFIDVQDLQEGKLQHYIFSYADAGFIYSIQVFFEDGVYSDGSHYAWYGEYLYPSESFPADPVEGQIANYNDGQGNIGLYRYDGTDWVPFGDNTILKAVNEAPETLEKGDVYALNAPFVAPESPDGQTVYGGNITDFKAAVEDNNNQIWVNTWDDTGHTETTNQGYFELDKNGDLAYYDYQADYYYILMDNYGQDGWIETKSGSVQLRWVGDNIFFYVVQESNGVYFNPDVDMTFDSVGSAIGVYQANFKTQTNVKIEVDEGTSVDGTLENPEQVVTTSSHHMYISFNNPSIVDGKVCELESYGDYYPLAYDDVNDRWTLYSTDGETVLLRVSDGQSGNVDFGDGNAYLSYSDGVLTAYTDYEKGWKNWDMGDGGEVLDPEELAKVSQLPAENRLIPAPQSYDSGRYLYTNGNSTSWNNAPSPEQYWGYPYEDSTAPVYSTSTYNVQWRKVVQSNDVLHIVKITVSDYETLVQNQQTDPNTLYLTYEPQA